MELHCLRHGLTVENLRGIYHGTSDGTVTPDEISKLRSVRFDKSHYDVIYCSPLGRCKDTAKALGISRLIEEPRIAERNFGIFEGLSQSECEARYPSEFAAFQRFDADYQMPKGESREQNLARVLSWLHDIESLGSVLAVTHGGTIDFLYRMSTGRDLHGGSEIFSASNASLSIFGVTWPQVRLISYDTGLVA
jgi:2,3-bisphosphoglycerate-dependent phosphoglycerate mutase